MDTTLCLNSQSKVPDCSLYNLNGYCKACSGTTFTLIYLNGTSSSTNNPVDVTKCVAKIPDCS